MIHHSLTKDSNTVSWDAIRRYHVETNGWKDIGYHFGVEDINGTYEALVGRPLDNVGAHCKEGEMNKRSIGICCVGNYDLIEPPPAMLDVLVNRLIVPWMHILSIPASNIVFHREYATYKSCPGTMFTKDLILTRLPGAVV
jgi:hypothetical protein